MLGGNTFNETDAITDYAKIEFSNGRKMLIQFDSENPDLAQQMKSQFMNFNQADVKKNNNIVFTIDNGQDITYSVNPATFKVAKAGDLMIAVDMNTSIGFLSQIQVFLRDQSVPYPVFGHVVYSQENLEDISPGLAVTRVSFVEMERFAPNTSYCSEDAFKKPFKFIGRIFTIAKIIIPIVIIIFGMVDLAKAVLGSKGDEIQKSIKSLAMRLIAGVVIFFIPTIINLIFALIDDWNQYYTDYSNCTKCLVRPNKC